MKYFEKNADIRYALKGMVKGFKTGKMDIATAGDRIDRLRYARNKLTALEHTNPVKFTEKTQEKIQDIQKMITGSETLLTAQKGKLFKMGAAPVHPMQGTMLNVQTRDSQRKYNSKVLGKKRADILVPLWR